MGLSRPIYLGADRVITDGSEISARGRARRRWAERQCAEATAGPPGRSAVWVILHTVPSWLRVWGLYLSTSGIRCRLP